VPGLSPAAHEDCQSAGTVEQGPGRLEPRQLPVSSNWQRSLDGPAVAQGFQRERRLVGRRDGQVPPPRREGLTRWTAAAARPARRWELVREQWPIEKALPYRSDDTLKEERGGLRLGQAPPARAVVNHRVLGRWRRKGWRQAAEARRPDGQQLNPSAEL
jgi:hypothetical protein